MIFETKKQLADFFGKKENDENIIIIWSLLKRNIIKDEHLVEAIERGGI